MKKKGYRALLAGALLAVLAVAGLPVTALAAEPLRVELPSVEIKLEGAAPSPDEEYKIVMQADDALFNPMPLGSTKDGYPLTIKGSGTVKVPALTYEKPGVYTYTISQVQGSNSQCTYDDTVYTMKVYITNRQDGKGLESEIVLSVSGMDGKPDKIKFVNKYPLPDNPDNPDGPQTGDNSNMALWFALMMVSLAGAIGTALHGKKNS
ncbi:MAG: FctA domain-containing protein [Eubacteriales bacterium]|nr:FctA domain-containing protein [Eubacteriales bacterium]